MHLIFRWIFQILLAAVLVSCLACGRDDGDNSADMVILNGTIFTSSNTKPWASAIAIKDGIIRYVGDDAGAHYWIGGGTRVVNASSKFITPGFMDAHDHAVWLGLLGPVLTSVYDAGNIDDLTRMVQAFAAGNPDLPFIMAIGWKYDYIPGHLPTLKMADDMIDDRPLILWSHDGHTGWVNTPMLRKMQASNMEAFRRLTPVYDEQNQPTGIFLHFYSVDPFAFFSMDDVGPNLQDQMAVSLKALLASGLKVGVTAHHDVMIHQSIWDQILRFDKKGVFSDCRIKGSYFINHYDLEDPDALVENLKKWKSLSKEADNSHLLLGDSVKIGMDGVSPSHTAFLEDEYSDFPGNHGVASYSVEESNFLLPMIDAMKLQICFHAVGDAAITRAIDALELARGRNGEWDSRHKCEHCSLVRQADMERMKALGIYASMQPTHFVADQATEEAVGVDRLSRSHPWRSLQDAGISQAYGTDYSIVPFNPILGLFIAATRYNYHFDTTWGPEQAIGVTDAIRHYTIGSAQSMKMDHIVGSLEVGKKADLVMFTIDLRRIVTPEFIMDFMVNHGMDMEYLDQLVQMTMVDGRVVHGRPEAAKNNSNS